jgi:hypothetical protein
MPEDSLPDLAEGACNARSIESIRAALASPVVPIPVTLRSDGDTMEGLRSMIEAVGRAPART